MEDPFAQLSTKTAGQQAVGVRPARYERDRNMIDSGKLDMSMFDKIVFIDAEERKAYGQGDVPHDQRAQQRDKATGKPVWRVELRVHQTRGDKSFKRTVYANVVSDDNPADRIAEYEQVELKDAWFGVTPKDDKCEYCKNTGYILWMKAGGIESATATRPHAVSSVA